MKASRSFVVSLTQLGALLLLWSPLARAQPLQIRHEPVACFMAERYPQIDACIEPASGVGQARVYFRAEDGPRWSFVEMKPVGSCYRAVLPPPQTATPRVVYYVSATALDRREARTTPQRATVVTEDKACTGRVGPFLSGAAVAVGGSTLPSGFIGSEGPVSHTAKTVVAAIVGAGAVGAGVALAAHSSAATPTTAPPDTTTPQTPASTSTTILAPPTTTTTTTTTTVPPATTTTTVPPATTTTTAPPTTTTTTTTPATTTTTVPATTTTTTATTTTTTTTTTATTTTTTTSPTTTTTMKKKKATTTRPVVLDPKEAQPEKPEREPRRVAGPPRSDASRFTSELLVPGGRGQVIVNGGEASYPGPGRTELALPARHGTNQVEVILVAGVGRPGTWTFDLGARARPGTLQLIAGAAAAVGSRSLVLELHGRAGERAVFSFEAE